MRIGRFALILAALVAAGCGTSRNDSFYATADDKLWTIDIAAGDKVTITKVGATGQPNCGSVARSPEGVLYSMCGEGMVKPGPQQLARLDLATGKATVFGETVTGMQVMGLEFAPDATLYAVGDANKASPTFNSLYSVNRESGAFTRIGSTAAPDFFHDFAVATDGTMYGSSGQALYSIDLKTGTANKVVDFVGGGGFGVMGLSYNGQQDRLYATDFRQPNSPFYVVDLKTGFLTPLAATGLPFTHGLVSKPR
jgi:hypothetical protein